MNVTKQLRIDKNELETFERLYPDLFSVFVQRALYLANRDSSLFQKVLLSPLLSKGLEKE